MDRGRLGLGLVCLAVGLIVIALAQGAMPAQSPPLYDGVVPLEAYLWLVPPPGQHGGAEGASATIPLRGSGSPLVAVATPEGVPQAQVFATRDTLTLPPGTRSLDVSITPIPAEGDVADGHIDGNVYRFVIANQDGLPVTAPEEGRVSVVMRAADPLLADARVARLVDGVWQPLESSSAGFGATFLAVVTEFGDFALIAPGPGPWASATTTTAASTPGTTAILPRASPSAAPVAPAPSPGGPTIPVALIVVLLAISLTGIAIVALQQWRSGRRQRRRDQARRVRRR